MNTRKLWLVKPKKLHTVLGLLSAVLSLAINLPVCASEQTKHNQKNIPVSCPIEAEERDNLEPGLAFANKQLYEAGIFFGEKKYVDATRLLKEALDKESKLTTKDSRPDLIAYWLADCHYLQAHYDDAEAMYLKAESYLKADDQSAKNKALELAILRGQLACLNHLKKNTEAEAVADRCVKLTKEIFGGGNINYGWSLLAHSEFLTKIGKTKESDTDFQHAICIFRKHNLDRLAKEQGIACPITCLKDQSKEKIRTNIWKLVFGTTNEKALPEDLFEDKSDAQTTFCQADYGFPTALALQKHAPGYVWADPSKEASGVIVCVHGLGLHHLSYDSFAREMVKDGFIVIAFDVRGFGSYLNSQGQEKLDLDGCVQDMKAIVTVLRQDYSDQPFFMLGESMGGAIVLRLCALYPDLLDGLVCSVPAAKRYKAGTTALTVALHYVSDPNKPFAIGRKVVAQSTKKTTERERWQSDPASKLELTPKELLSFQRFMNDNSIYARKILHTPVILFQGNEDRLVKKTGTYDLFEAIATKQKTLVVIGGAEHLIFEASQFKDDITTGVTGWLKAHGARCEYVPEEPKGKTAASTKARE